MYFMLIMLIDLGNIKKNLLGFIKRLEIDVSRFWGIFNDF